MERTSFEDWNCSVARSLEVIGDWWTMMIVREAFYGTRTFIGFEEHLGISKNTLTRRLRKMELDGLLERHPSATDGRSLEYRLTDKGRDLFAVLISIMQWGDKWMDPDGLGPPVVIRDRAAGEPLSRISVAIKGGKQILPRNAVPTPGTGADRVTQARFSTDEGDQ